MAPLFLEVPQSYVAGGFDFAFNTSINRQQIYQLLAGEFLAKTEDILLFSQPGVSKNHLAEAIGHELIKQGRLVLYRSVFDKLSMPILDGALWTSPPIKRVLLNPIQNQYNLIARPQSVQGSRPFQNP